MRAVNLMPRDARRGMVGGASRSGGVVYAVLGLLAVIVLLVTVDVLSSNTVNRREADLDRVNAQLTAAQSQATSLAPYTTFAKLAQSRAATVEQIAAARFDWHAALTGLSRVVPANTSLTSLNATVAPGASSGSSSGGSADLRGDISSPAFELAGCTRTQDDVASLVSRLRLINGVSRVSVENTQTSSSSTSGTSVGAGGGAGGCPDGSPSFNLVVFFQPLPSAGPDGVSAPVATAAPTGTAPAAAATTPAATTTPATTTTAGATS